MKWDTVKLGDWCDSCLGKMLDQNKNKGEYFPYLANINVRWGGFDLDNLSMMRFEPSEKERYGLKFGDLLVCEGGEPGRCAIWKNQISDMRIQKAIHRVRVKEGLDNFYLFYWFLLAGKTGKLSQYYTGSTIKHIPGEKLKKIIIDFPPYPVQQKIAGILSAYDDLIENNQKQIKLLEEAAQRLYKEWFVDFRFPGHETAKFINGLPEGWSLKRLSDVAPIITGKKDANFGTDNGRYLFFTCAQEPITASSYSFDCNAVILAGNGDFNVKLYRGKFEAYQRTYVLSPFKNEYLYLLFYAVRENMRHLFQGASGSTIKFLTKPMLENISVFIPPKELLIKYNVNTETIQRKIETLKETVILTKEARDRLLPKLINGEIEV